MNLTLHVWRQKSANAKGHIETHKVSDISPDMSFLEMLDILNDNLTKEGKEPVVFDSDCREGICGTCSLTINGVPHGPEHACTTCQLHMRSFADGDEIYVEPFRAAAFPVMRDLMIDRAAMDRIIQAGGYVSVNTGGAVDANAVPIYKEDAEYAMDAAACIGCGACVASCPNASAMLFTSAKVAHLATVPQGQTERESRVRKMIEAHDREGFGHCSNNYECEAVCPKEIGVKFITQLNREYLSAAAGGDVDG